MCCRPTEDLWEAFQWGAAHRSRPGGIHVFRLRPPYLVRPASWLLIAGNPRLGATLRPGLPRPRVTMEGLP